MTFPLPHRPLRHLATVATAAAALTSCDRGSPPPDSASPPPEPRDAAAEIALPAPDPSPLTTSASVFERSFAGTPVHWRLWGKNAFETAKKHGRPIYLLIGYSACPWCAQMRTEVFSDPENAAFINANFVPVVVDAEAHPEVNRIFMVYFQTSKGTSGWPLSVFVTPDGAPLSAASFLDTSASKGNPEFLTVASHIISQWKKYPEHYAEQAARDTAPLIKRFGKQPAEALVRPTSALVDMAFAQLAADFDPLSGGFDSQPKFLFPPRLDFLLGQAELSGTGDFRRKRALDMVTTTLDSASSSAVYDVLSGGFFRYTTDPYWNAPNFEKHLIDQALAAATLSRAAALAPEKAGAYRDVVSHTFAFLDSTFAAGNGTYYQSQATGSETPGLGRAIGEYHTWSASELEATLGKDDAALAAKLFGTKLRGNLPSSSTLHTSVRQRNVLIPPAPEAVAAAPPGAYERIREKLLAARSARPAPLTDNSVHFAPNACTALAMARAARVFSEPSLAAKAETLLSALRATHCGGTPLPRIRTTLEGEPGLPAIAEDFATAVAAYLEMHQTTGDRKWLDDAIATQEAQTAAFYDANARGFFSGADPSHMFIRIKPVQDAAVPAANSLSVKNLITLSEVTGDAGFRKQAWESLYGLSPFYAGIPSTSSTMIEALAVLLATGKSAG